MRHHIQIEFWQEAAWLSVIMEEARTQQGLVRSCTRLGFSLKTPFLSALLSGDGELRELNQKPGVVVFARS